MESKMSKCQVCGNEVDLPFICAYCGLPHCSEHRLPEKHNCSSLHMARSPVVSRPGTTVFWEYKITTPKGYTTRTSLHEIRDIIISLIVLGFCFSARYLFSAITGFAIMFGIALLTLGSGFVCHELMHKLIAQKYGCWAEFRLWWYGLGLALLFALVSGGRFIFAAPGAVYITPTVSLGGYGIDKKTNGLISISGPLTNIAAALIFFFTAQLGKLSGNFLASQIGLLGLQINLWLAAFNLLPFGPLDGQKIFAWNIAIWAGIAIPLWAINILLFIGII